MSHEAHIKRIIAKKKIRLIKNSLKAGAQEGQRLEAALSTQLRSAVAFINEAKVNIVAQKVLALVEQQLSQNPKVIVAMAIKLLKNIAEHTDVELYAHPVDSATIKGSLGEIATACASARKITIIDDDTFIRGSLVIKAHKSIIDAHITTQVYRAQELLLGYLEATHGTNNHL